MVRVLEREATTPGDYQDLEETPETVASTMQTMATDAAHLATVLRGPGYPPTS